MDVPAQRLRTYIIEDSAVLLASLGATLEELTPVQVVGTADDEATAVQWLLAHRDGCDLVIVDVYLQSGSGLGVLRRAAEAGLPAKCVVLTSYATPDVRARCLQLGADRVFDKSVELDDLISYCMQLGGTTEASPPSL